MTGVSAAGVRLGRRVRVTALTTAADGWLSVTPRPSAKAAARPTWVSLIALCSNLLLTNAQPCASMVAEPTVARELASSAVKHSAAFCGTRLNGCGALAVACHAPSVTLKAADTKAAVLVGVAGVKRAWRGRRLIWLGTIGLAVRCALRLMIDAPTLAITSAGTSACVSVERRRARMARRHDSAAPATAHTTKPTCARPHPAPRAAKRAQAVAPPNAEKAQCVELSTGRTAPGLAVARCAAVEVSRPTLCCTTSTRAAACGVRLDMKCGRRASTSEAVWSWRPACGAWGTPRGQKSQSKIQCHSRSYGRDLLEWGI